MLLMAAIAVFAAVTRLYDVSAKPLHHDESLFAYYGHFLYKGYGYVYQPILHGPVLQNVSALIFLLFGDSKFTMRLPAVVGGLLLLVVAWFWRRYLGRAGVVAALAAIALSPSLAYYSRFLRNDVPYLAATLWCALMVLRAAETGERRYWLWGILSATLMFSMMESSIFFFAACAGFLVVAAGADWLGGRRLPPEALRRFPGHAVIFAPRERGGAGGPSGWLQVMRGIAAAMALTAAAAWFFRRMFADTVPIGPVIASLLNARGWSTLTDADVYAVLTVLLFLALVPLCLFVMAHYQRPHGATGMLHYLLRLAWARRWIILCGVAISVAFYATIFTTYFTNTRGQDFWGRDVLLTPLQIYKNTWDYWIDQHKLHRIKGPFHYYWPLLLMYELPLVAVVAAGLWRSWFGGPRGRRHLVAFLVPQVLAAGLLWMAASQWYRDWLGYRIDWNFLDDHLHVSHPVHLLMALLYAQILVHATGLLVRRGHWSEAFLVFWTVTSLFAYSYAGEKVPWLVVHVVGPMCLLSGLYVERWARDFRLTRPRIAVAAAVAGIAALWQARNIVFVCFIHPHSPQERLVYNHTSPDVEWAVDRIGEIARATNLGSALPMMIRGEVEWPLYWYLRDYTNFMGAREEPLETTTRPVVLVNWEASGVPNLVQNYTIRRLKVREWWEPPMLNPLVLADIFRWLTPRESLRDSVHGMRFAAAVTEWKKLFHYLAYRQIWLDPDNVYWSNGVNEFAFCVRKDLGETFLSHAAQTRLPRFRTDIPVYP